MRHRFVSDLVKELLGPRHGALEQFPPTEDPRNEYSTGQLIPPNIRVARAPEEDQGLGANLGGGEEESEDEVQASFVNQAMIDSGQNFRRIPSSMGISFVLSEMPKAGEIKICASWGRYSFTEAQGWSRTPNCWIDRFEGETEEERRSPDGAVSLTYKLTRLRDDTIKVSLYLASAFASNTDSRLRTDQIIFQPELRVRLADPAALLELGDLGFLTDDREWRLSTRQYDKLRVFARGHLCGAYWKDIDPQRETEPPGNHPAEIPFTWIDGNHFIKTEPGVAEFIAPDLRTDFIPMYSAPAPKISASGGGDLDLRAERIAECQSPEQLAEMLRPLLDSYQQWIDDLKPDRSAGSPDLEIIRRHREAIDRIKGGIVFLKNDREAYFSFLFMNKAMALQYRWGKKPPNDVMSWRPFQLAFILLSLPSTAKTDFEERGVCDTIWFPTGGGKTEAYLGLAAFALAYRRRSSQADETGSRGGEGTCVISRYTLRLLTIQQFRRALKMIMACELLRCHSVGGGLIGWKPPGCPDTRGMIWGRSPFSIGLWVGAAVTPNQMSGAGYREFAPGAITLLKSAAVNDTSDPAQVIECPSCSSVLSLPVDGIGKGPFTLNLVVYTQPPMDSTTIAALETSRLAVSAMSYRAHGSKKCGYFQLSLNLKQAISPKELVRWWQDKAESVLGVENCSFNVARPGYFPMESGRRGAIKDYEIRCTNPDCALNQTKYRLRIPTSGDSWDWGKVHPLFQEPGSDYVSLGTPIRAITVDEKLYGDPPSMLIATCDKLAMAAFNNDAASLFGRVRTYDGKSYSQEQAPSRNRFIVRNFPPPSLIIQDELHLLEGPLGSSFGLYETIVEKLCGGPKYIASSATIRNSLEQVAALTGRRARVFPPVGLDISDGFFLRSDEAHPLDESSPGRLFLGLAFPGRAPQTPMLRTWGRLLQTAQDLRREGANPEDLDYFWTLIGYFNAVRELAQGETLFRQDIPQYLDKVQNQTPGSVKRDLPIEGFRNLSSQTGSSELPGILATMERTITQGDALNAVATTSMFGTGVDVTRLSMMIVHGQPKSASQYIQAVGRIGRTRAGLAITFFRVSKPRDLNHYEYFTGYHRKLPVAVEPITVKPLAPKALERITGALLAILVRNWRDEGLPLPPGIDTDDGGALIRQMPATFLEELLRCFGRKWDDQPEQRRPPNRDAFLDYIRSQYEKWHEYARRQQEAGQTLPYAKGGVVVLGTDDRTPSVFSNIPRSLREVEPVISIYTKG